MGIIIGSILSMIFHLILAIVKFVLKIIKKILIATRLIVPAVLGGGFYLLFYFKIIENNPFNIALAVITSSVITIYFYYRLIRKAIKNKAPAEQKKNHR